MCMNIKREINSVGSAIVVLESVPFGVTALMRLQARVRRVQKRRRARSGQLAPLGCRGSLKRAAFWGAGASRHPRSEEHTSELQSRLHLVCRLLLEKKKS